MNFKDLIKPHNKTSEIDFDDTEEGDLLEQFLCDTEKKQMNFEIRCDLFISET